MKIIYLFPETGFSTELRSDTVWGIICWGIRNVYGAEALENFLGSTLEGNPGFIVSSAFPMTRRGEMNELFLPRPILPLKPYADPDVKLSRQELINRSQLDKKNKKKQYINKEDFISIIHGQIEMEEALANQGPPDLESFSVTHNTIDRIRGGTLQKDNMGQLFHTDEYYFNTDPGNGTDSGLFFLASGPDVSMLEGAMRWLGHTGIGGNRNIGKGKFKIDIDEFTLDQPDDFNAFMTLSLCYPSIERNEPSKFKSLPLFNYVLEERRGYFGFQRYGMYIKPPVLMFKEGSVFPALQGHEKFGGLIKISDRAGMKSDSHPVYHYGIGFMVKLKIQTTDEDLF
jgi:CRISPR-associated protein Csm4